MICTTIMLVCFGISTWPFQSVLGDDPSDLVRIGNPVGGHIHPAVCQTKKGTLVVTYGRVNHRDLRISRSSDGGRTWSETKTPLYDEQAMMGRVLYSVTYDAGTLYAAGIDSTLAYSRDRGRSWTQVDTGFSKPDLYCIDMVEGTGLAAGSGGHLIQTSDGGLTWRVVDVPEEIKRSWLSGLDLKKGRTGRIEGLVVGQRGTHGHFSDGVVTWQRSSAEREGTEK